MLDEIEFCEELFIFSFKLGTILQYSLSVVFRKVSDGQSK